MSHYGEALYGISQYGEDALDQANVTIQDIPIHTALPRISFDWSPKSVAYTLNFGGDTFPWTTDEPQAGAPDQPDIYYTNAGEDLTFTATVETDPGDFILEYLWDFGDGSIGYGGEVNHTYRVASPQARIHLRVTDNHRRQVSTGRQLTLVFGTSIVVSEGIVV